MASTLKTVITDLEDMFAVFNDRFFENQLSQPVITVSPDTKNKGFGWTTSWKAWHSTTEGEGDGYFEINICAEHLARPVDEVAETMLHGMVHLFDLENGVKDCSRGGTYHNAKFKDSAEAHGLTCESDKKYGWCVTRLNDESKAEVDGFMNFLGKPSFDLFREGEAQEEKEKKGGKSNSRKYVCPVCGMIIRATKEVHVICGDCNVPLVEE